ncbi:hypothetical protein M0651_11110 [Paenibacillus sp. MBLB2552]|uniref:Uncharacterized protein n=1 Tax=Paenibacillus mellifer TaxID=2937794 RepID=A0A9X1XYI2_9BACL|nr:hypothetical protein [Paenibacillus mellifer]MCK8487724.1 hypothetical protein [Paenibacillus mellifer]
MKKLTILALILGALGFGYIYIGNQYSSTPIEAVEKVRYEMKGHLLYEAETDRGKILFILRDLQNGQTINAEYVQKTPLLGWKWGYGGGHTLPSIHDKDPDSYWTDQYFSSTKGTKYDFPSPFLFGVIRNPQIDSIQVYSYATKESFTASIKATGDRNVRLWYQFLPEEQGTKFKLTAEADHRIISTQISE